MLGMEEHSKDRFGTANAGELPAERDMASAHSAGCFKRRGMKPREPYAGSRNAIHWCKSVPE